MIYLRKFETHSDYVAFTESEEFIRPNVSACDEEDDVHFNPHTFADDYLTFVALEDGTISFNIRFDMGTEYITSISYSTDGGETWTTTNNTNNKSENLVITVNVSEGDKVMWKGDSTQLGFYDEDEGDSIGSFFSSDCEFDTQGNVMSLLYGDDFKNEATIENEAAFTCLFYDYEGTKTCGVVNAKNLSLPATTLANSCYRYMFFGCSNLTTAPELLATTLANYCYSGMFYGCTSLTTAPELLATTLANYCYNAMFARCTSLTIAPELPATTLVSNCYYNMFENCISLTTAPELLATTLASSCYSQMFKGCTSLNYIKAMFTTTPSNSYTSNWVNGVASSGTFVKNSAASWNVTGVNGIPTGWTVQTAS